MKIAYYLNEGRKKNLYCRISDGSERVSFSLGYTIDPENWNSRKEEGSHEDPYFYTLSNFKQYLDRRYHELRSLEVPAATALATLKSEAETFIDGSGIIGVARKMFDDENKIDGVPTYDQFIQAFERHSGLKKEQYKAQTLDSLILFHTNGGVVWEMDTYQGLSARLASFVDRRSCEEICTMTNESFWSEIYMDAGIEKHVFLPKLLLEWERHWQKTYQRINDTVGKTTHLEEQKQVSWRQFQVFMECYEAGDIVEIAASIDDMQLYPLVVITMLGIFNAPVCYEEYCELEFQTTDEWESIDLGGDLDDPENDKEEKTVVSDSLPIFFIRESEL